MRMRLAILIHLALGFTAVSARPVHLAASLGGRGSSVEADREHVQGALRPLVKGAAVTRHEIQPRTAS